MVRLRDWRRRCVLLVLLAGLAALVACGDDAPSAGIPSSSGGFAPPSFGSAGSCAIFPGSANPVGNPDASPAAGVMPVAPSAQFRAPAVHLDVPPPPISGGTLLRTADASTLIAADPDRDSIDVIDIASRSVRHRVALRSQDEPGRLVEDSTRSVHVVLRGARSIASFDPRSPAEPRRIEVCDLPRGIAYDAPRDRLYVACAEGTLVPRPELRTERSSSVATCAT
jgi:hypothetical protein